MTAKSMQCKFEKYECNLDPDVQKIATSELREDEAIREQTLDQFRQWIIKHPTIKNCRTDAVFLLRFLRTKKFSLPLAQEMLERYLTIRQIYPQWFRNLDINEPDIEAIIDSGYLVPLLERDNNGRKVLLSCAGRFDSNKYSSAHMIRIHSIVVEALMDDEQNQIFGYTHINDESGLTLNHLSNWSISDLRNILGCLQNSTPMRHKQMHFINIPSYGTKIIEFAISLLSKKLKERILVHRSIEHAQQIIDPKILPKEYGGEIPLSEMIDNFKQILREKREELKALDDMYIDTTIKSSCALSSEDCDNISGSFRKLEID